MEIWGLDGTKRSKEACKQYGINKENNRKIQCNVFLYPNEKGEKTEMGNLWNNQKQEKKKKLIKEIRIISRPPSKTLDQPMTTMEKLGTLYERNVSLINNWIFFQSLMQSCQKINTRFIEILSESLKRRAVKSIH